MSQENQRIIVSNELLDAWAVESTGPVALHLRQQLLPVEGEGGVIFPPTYADIGYNIDTLTDGTRVATIDSVGSQANRLEPSFKRESSNRAEWLVPQIQIMISEEKTVSLLDLPHRAADSVVRSSPGLFELAEVAFDSLRKGDAGPLCEIAPTSLVFGVWDSRGDSGEKRPRLVRSIIRAWNVEPLHAASQFNSVWKELSQQQQDELTKAVKDKEKLSAAGLKDAPGVFRKTDKVPQFRDGAPNPEARVLGGVIPRGPIERQITVNLLALRALRGKNDDETKAIRKYVLGLALIAATAEIDLFLREGCLLRYADENDTWHQVPRRGDPTAIRLDKATIAAYAEKAALYFRAKWNVRWPPDRHPRIEYSFNLKRAKELMAKKGKDESAAGGE